VSIEKYLSEINKLLEQTPFKLISEVHVENRGNIDWYIRGNSENKIRE
jgi:hypothetical protein